MNIPLYLHHVAPHRVYKLLLPARHSHLRYCEDAFERHMLMHRFILFSQQSFGENLRCGHQSGKNRRLGYGNFTATYLADNETLFIANELIYYRHVAEGNAYARLLAAFHRFQWTNGFASWQQTRSPRHRQVSDLIRTEFRCEYGRQRTVCFCSGNGCCWFLLIDNETFIL